MAELNELQRLHPNAVGPVREYAGIIETCLSSHAAGLVVFGRALADDFDANRDVVASVLLVDEVDLDSLRQLAQHGSRLGGLRIAAPLVMTPAYVASSRDTFALELLEIQQKHATLWGADPFADLTFEPEHLRLQCEREFKRLLIQMRQGLLKAADQEFLLAGVVQAVADDLIRTLRGVLWLHGERKPVPRDQVVARAGQQAGRDLTGLRHAADRDYEAGWDDFQAFYADLEALSTWVDRSMKEVG